MYDYFKKLECKSKSKGAFEKTIDATGITHSTLSRILNENKTNDKFESPTKRYMKSRKIIAPDDFDKDAIQRRIYQIYEKKEHVTLSKLLVCILCMYVCMCVCTLLHVILADFIRRPVQWGMHNSGRSFKGNQFSVS